MQELVVESLVVSLAMGVVDVLAHEETHVPFADSASFATRKYFGAIALKV